jgi:four helix bundle protein
MGMGMREDQTPIRPYRDLVAWQKAMALAEGVYEATSKFPKEEVYGLTSQMRCAGVPIASNIAEGHDRHSRGEFLQFIGHARGSLSELETQTMLASRLGHLPPEREIPLTQPMAEVGRLLNGLRKSLRTGDSDRPPTSS